MKAKLISYSQTPGDFPDLVDEEAGEVGEVQALIAFCARVSNPDNQMNMQTADKLIKYLVRNKHWSPLEMVSACLEIETTRDIARQLLRHRSFSFQEFSQRYAVSQEFVLREARLQDPKNRQNSVTPDENNDEHRRIMWQWEAMQKKALEQAKAAYSWALDNGIAKEQARAVLPEGLTMSRLYVNGTLRSWVHYIELRNANGTQKEHMELARECAVVIAKVFPMIKDFCYGDA
jgi:thymidylate synthase (FAD)